VAVPNLIGMKTQAAKRRLTASGLRVSVRAVISTKPVGTVVAQRPLPRAVVARGTLVRLSISSAAIAGQVSVPDVIGDLKETAEQRLANAGLSSNVAYVDSLQLVGTVVAQDPQAGVRVPSGARVTISISRGPGP
jgi:beta-lactam-binding protein with PASTA domain